MSKRIVFSTATPNDQGGIIPNNVIDFNRFKSNPVLLCQHNWNAPPLGLMTDIKEIDGQWTGIPVFNRITKESQEYGDMYEGGWIKACSIGGEAEWKTNTAGQAVLTKEGLRQCEHFELYEISIVTLPSNKDAVTNEQLAAKIYEKSDLQNISNTITTLSSQYKIPPMSTKKTDKQKAAELALQTANAEAAAELLAAESGTTILAAKDDPSSGQLPGVIKDLVGLLGRAIGLGQKPEATVATATVVAAAATNAAPAQGDQPKSTIADPTQPQPTPTGLAAKKEAAKKKAEQAKEKAAKAVEAAKAAKEKASKDDASKEEKDSYKSMCDAAEAAVQNAEEAEAAYKAAMDDDEGEEEENSGGKNSAKAKLSAQKPAAPILKTMEQLRAELKLAAPPQHTAKIVSLGNGVSFSALSASTNEEGKRILGRVLTKDGGQKDVADYAVVLNAIMTDGKYAALVEKTRIMQNVDERRIGTYRTNLSERTGGLTLQHLASEVNSGNVNVMGRDNVMRQKTTLNSTDDALAAPALTTIEWLSLAIFNLFPSTSWKNDIPMFGAQMTAENTGIIWANIAADPEITRGTQPVSPTDYTYQDTAVSLKLVPYWLQPMRWTPLTMHQLRYDMMATGWAQAFAKWGAVMDDDMIYTLASTVPAGSIITTLGQAGRQSFTLQSGQANPNNFYYNPAFTGSLATPAYNDIANIEQIYNNQNFDLEREKVKLVMDPTMKKFISQDPDTKSLLTRWVESNSSDLLKISHSELNMRSRVAVYDPATGLVKDPRGVIPSTAVSAGIGFLPSQVGMGIGLLDVFMIQDPSAYGYRMSADIRIGIVPLRPTYNGTTLYTYGTPNV